MHGFHLTNLRDDRDVTKGYGQSFGLSINFVDVRNRNIDYTASNFIHHPRNRYMYKPALTEIGDPTTRSKLHNGQWVHINKDIFSLIAKAFRRAKHYGETRDAVDPLISERLGDYSITGINFGREVSSLHQVEMQVPTFRVSSQLR